jgi:hypothetical protein
VVIDENKARCLLSHLLDDGALIGEVNEIHISPGNVRRLLLIHASMEVVLAVCIPAKYPCGAKAVRAVPVIDAYWFQLILLGSNVSTQS